MLYNRFKTREEIEKSNGIGWYYKTEVPHESLNLLNKKLKKEDYYVYQDNQFFNYNGNKFPIYLLKYRKGVDCLGEECFVKMCTEIKKIKYNSIFSLLKQYMNWFKYKKEFIYKIEKEAISHKIIKLDTRI